MTKKDGNTPTFSNFRKMIDSIPAWKETTVCKILYLLALNRSEIVTKVNPHELSRKRTDAYGKHAKFQIKTYKKKISKKKFYYLQLP